MAANKFATMLHKSTHKIIVILVYAVLEWILITLILLNSSFTYLIRKFASYFGLKPQCLWCSRIDHILEPGENINSYRDLVCDTHATEISKLSYCSSHQRLAETENMCMECLASHEQQNEESVRMTRRIAIFSWASSHKHEKADRNFRCSCCSKEAYPPYLLFKSSWGALNYSKDGSRLIVEAVDDENDAGESKDQRLSSDDENNSHFEGNNEAECGNEKCAADEFQVISDIDSFSVTEVAEENCSRSGANLQYEEKKANEGEDAGKNSVHSSCDDNILGQAPLIGIDEGIKEKARHKILQRSGKKDVDEAENSSVLKTEECKNARNNKTDQSSSIDGVGVGAETMNEQDRPTEETTGCSLLVDQTKSMYLEDREAADDLDQNQGDISDNFNYLHEKLMLSEKSGMEESLDGSVASEMEGGDPVLTLEKLKSALKAERKALSALYSELEEERSASAVAANQTLAMITRLQEEKAAMQMEALQYQRMMEEQAEYDQEAFQLLNELMVKRENEKQELEKTLAIYRIKVLNYETNEKMRTLRRSMSGGGRSENSSASCSNSEDINELPSDLNHEPVGDEGSSFCGHRESRSDRTPAAGVVNLEEMAQDCVQHITAVGESLIEFEEERLSILDQLKKLEEKLITIGDDEFVEDLKAIGQSSKENGDFNDLNNEKVSMASMVKSLLPFLDAADNGTEQVDSGSVEPRNSSMSVPVDTDSKRLVIEEEVDHIYERLQALEADREFLEHCMSSIKEGDEGVDLLQKVLQQVRDLRAVELRARDFQSELV